MKQHEKPIFSLKLRTISLLAALALFLPIVLSGCKQTNADIQERMELSVVKKRSFDVTVSTIGVLEATRSHMLSSDIRGDECKILYIVDDGKHVKKGELLIRIDPAPFEEKISKYRAETAALESGVKAKAQLLEWEKNQVEKNISTNEYNLKVAKLEYKRLTEGEGPLQINQYIVETAKIKQEYDKYISYKKDLETLNKNGFANPSELLQAKSRIAEYKEKYEAAQNTLSSYKDHVYPSLEESAKAKVEKAKRDILQAGNDGVIKIAKAAAELEEAKARLFSKEAALNQAMTELSKTDILAPFDGIAILFETFRDGEKRKPRVGDLVIRNQPILYLPDISAMIVKTRIREVDLHKISMDQGADVLVDAYPEAVLKGQVAFIGALASESNRSGTGGKYFGLTIAVNSKDSRLRPGMTARVTILADHADQVPSLPVNAVFWNNHAPFCYKHLDRSFVPTNIVTGKRNADFVEILSGLTPGEQVSLIKPDDKWVDQAAGSLPGQEN